MRKSKDLANATSQISFSRMVLSTAMNLALIPRSKLNRVGPITLTSSYQTMASTSNILASTNKAIPRLTLTAKNTMTIWRGSATFTSSRAQLWLRRSITKNSKERCWPGVATSHPDELSAEHRHTSYSIHNFDFRIDTYYFQDHIKEIVFGNHAYNCANCYRIFTTFNEVPKKNRPYCTECRQFKQ